LHPDDELCLCFHVTRRKVENYLRVERPVAPAQLADCYGAGTGCGWCRPLLRKLFEAHRARGPCRVAFSRPPAEVRRCSLLEEPEGPPLPLEGSAVRLTLRPFEIVSLRVRF